MPNSNIPTNIPIKSFTLDGVEIPLAGGQSEFVYIEDEPLNIYYDDESKKTIIEVDISPKNNGQVCIRAKAENYEAEDGHEFFGVSFLSVFLSAFCSWSLLVGSDYIGPLSSESNQIEITDNHIIIYDDDNCKIYDLLNHYDNIFLAYEKA